jgi:glycosyltransferase involved in cell wall biosynthesis
VILQVVRLDYLKDHATAVRAMGRVAREVPSARLLLVGEGPEGPAIRAQVEQLGLQRPSAPSACATTWPGSCRPPTSSC